MGEAAPDRVVVGVELTDRVMKLGCRVGIPLLGALNGDLAQLQKVCLLRTDTWKWSRSSTQDDSSPCLHTLVCRQVKDLGDQPLTSPDSHELMLDKLKRFRKTTRIISSSVPQ
jgi:hypothetical protein